MQLAHKRATAAARATAAMRPSLALRARSVVSMQPSVVLHARRSSTRALAVVAPAEVNSPLAPAVLEGTPKPGEFPISSERLIELAKALYEARAGVKVLREGGACTNACWISWCLPAMDTDVPAA